MTAIKTMGLFPVPVTMANFGEDAKDLNESLIADSFSEKAMHPIPIIRSATGPSAWQSASDLEERYESFALLRENIKNVLYSVMPGYGFAYDGNYDDIFECKMFWANILSEESSFMMPHIRGTGNTVFSGVYFPTSGLTPQHEDYHQDEDYEDVEIRASSTPRPGDLVLFDPAAVEKRQPIPNFVVRYPYYGSEICIKPKKSHLIVFPNYLSHMVTPIPKDFVRLSISFSLIMKHV